MKGAKCWFMEAVRHCVLIKDTLVQPGASPVGPVTIRIKQTHQEDDEHNVECICKRVFKVAAV